MRAYLASTLRRLADWIAPIVSPAFAFTPEQKAKIKTVMVEAKAQWNAEPEPAA